MQHREQILSLLSWFDRAIFSGRLPLSYAAGLKPFLDGFGLKLEGFKDFAARST